MLYFTSLPVVTILLQIYYYTSLPGVTIFLQVHHHTVLYVFARGHNHSNSISPFCTLRRFSGSQSLYKNITILYFTSLPVVTIILKYITKLYFTSLPGVPIPLQVHHHPVLYVFVWGHNPSTSTSPYCTLRLWPGSQSFYKYITILYFCVSARGHNPSIST